MSGQACRISTSLLEKLERFLQFELTFSEMATSNLLRKLGISEDSSLKILRLCSHQRCHNKEDGTTNPNRAQGGADTRFRPRRDGKGYGFTWNPGKIQTIAQPIPTLEGSSGVGGLFCRYTLQVVQLRKACSHPYLFSGVEPEPFEEGEHLVQASGKLLILDVLLQKLHSNGHRVLIFAQMTRTLDILQDYLGLRGYSYERLDGSVRAEERFAALQRFSEKYSGVHESSNIENPNDDGHKAFVFLISTRAGGVGLNLMAADTVIFYEQDWNPQVDKQALQRAHRIGQLHHVLAINIVTENTVEEVIMHRAKRKLQLTRNVIGPDDSDLGENGSEDVARNDLRSMIIYGLHKFDPSEDVEKSSNETGYTEMKSMAEKVLDTRLHGKYNESNLHYDKNADEAAFESWMNKAKDGSLNDELVNDVRGRNKASCHNELEEARAEKRRKTEDKKLAKWEALGYRSLAVEDVSERLSIEPNSNSGEVQFVFGDCTNPIKGHSKESTIIFSCVDNSGNWGSGGMFDALSNVSQKVPDAYLKAHECQDLHSGDLHLIRIS
ncbi:hypothetical protein KI387_042403, partial [Taxus chinensis]